MDILMVFILFNYFPLNQRLTRKNDVDVISPEKDIFCRIQGVYFQYNKS